MSKKTKKIAPLAQARVEIEKILKKYNLERRYFASITDKAFKDETPESTIVGINTEFDNQLRNFAFKAKIKPSKRLDTFLVKYVSGILEDFPQRSPEADKHSLRYHLDNDKLIRHFSTTRLQKLKKLKAEIMKKFREAA